MPSRKLRKRYRRKAEATAPGWRRWLLVRRWAADPDDVAFYVAYGPEGTAEAELVRVCGMRWQVEEGFAQAGGIISFVVRQDRVRFQIDRAAAARVGLTIGSRLLEVAEAVTDGGRR